MYYEGNFNPKDGDHTFVATPKGLEMQVYSKENWTGFADQILTKELALELGVALVDYAKGKFDHLVKP